MSLGIFPESELGASRIYRIRYAEVDSYGENVKTASKTVVGLICLIVGVLVTSAYYSPRQQKTPVTPTEWNESFNTYDLSKNPYELQGHSGILDPRFAFYRSPQGVSVMPVPGGGLHLEQMIDAHTAMFRLVTLGSLLEPAGELVVLLDDSHPPDSTRPWRVTVEEPAKLTNGLGGELTVSAVHFDGYVPPSEPAPLPTATPETPKAPETAPVQPAASTASEQPSAPVAQVDPSEPPTGSPKKDEAEESKPAAIPQTPPASTPAESPQ